MNRRTFFEMAGGLLALNEICKQWRARGENSWIDIFKPPHLANPSFDHFLIIRVYNNGNPNIRPWSVNIEFKTGRLFGRRGALGAAQDTAQDPTVNFILQPDKLQSIAKRMEEVAEMDYPAPQRVPDFSFSEQVILTLPKYAPCSIALTGQGALNKQPARSLIDEVYRLAFGD